jgi:hypothetical protein
MGEQRAYTMCDCDVYEGPHDPTMRCVDALQDQLSAAEQALEAERSQLERELWQLIPTTGGIDARTLKITMINHGDCTHCRIALNRHNNSAYEPLIVEGQSLFQCMLIFIRMRRQQISEKGESR